MPDTRRAERVLKRWFDNQTMLWVIAGVVVADSCPPTVASLRGQLALLPGDEVLILKSSTGSFLNIASWGSAKFLDVKTDWQGTMMEVRFLHEILLVADYEPPSEFFKVTAPTSPRKTKTT